MNPKLVFNRDFIRRYCKQSGYNVVGENGLPLALITLDNIKELPQ
jgi:hypothetical protein